ncbi:MAG TPA: ATP-binding protein [bacterium]|nr:ATP-binding protein [bacterium]
MSALAAAPRAHADEIARLQEHVVVLEQHLHKRDEQRRALLHILSDLHDLNRRLSNQRKAMLHILADYEEDRRRLGSQAERADNSRRALLHILQDAHRSNLKLEDGRKAMIHIMGDLHETTEEIKRREQELREKQEQLVQAGKLATLGELTTGVAHELNNPLNNIGLFLGNSIDLIEMGQVDTTRILRDLRSASQQVRKASEIISHLRTFGRAAPVGHESVAINQVIHRALSLLQEQFRIRQITIELDLDPAEPHVNGSPIQLEQVFINMLANARDALTDAPRKLLTISSAVAEDFVIIVFSDSGPGVPKGLEQRIFDPFFTTKEVGEGTGLGLSITYGILKDHKGTISLDTSVKDGATFRIELPLAVALQHGG